MGLFLIPTHLYLIDNETGSQRSILPARGFLHLSTPSHYTLWLIDGKHGAAAEVGMEDPQCCLCGAIYQSP